MKNPGALVHLWTSESQALRLGRDPWFACRCNKPASLRWLFRPIAWKMQRSHRCTCSRTKNLTLEPLSLLKGLLATMLLERRVTLLSTMVAKFPTGKDRVTELSLLYVFYPEQLVLFNSWELSKPLILFSAYFFLCRVRILKSPVIHTMCDCIQ